jgi:RNA polymerase sigma-70 factor (ECF subfamily)
MMCFDDVLAAARAGEPLALHEIYARHAPFVFGYLRGRGTHNAEDLTSEVFVSVIRALSRFEGSEASFRSWLLVIAHRRLLDERRQLARKPCEAVDPAWLARSTHNRFAPSAADEALAGLEHTEVMGALRRLTDAQREVVLLHAVAGLSLPEIADLLGRRLGAVKSLHRRGLCALALAFGERELDHTSSGFEAR